VGDEGWFGVWALGVWALAITAVATISAANEAHGQNLRTRERRTAIRRVITVSAPACCCSLADGECGGWCDPDVIGWFIVRVLIVDELLRRPYERGTRRRVGQALIHEASGSGGGRGCPRVGSIQSTA
jgi:hypothetical protein